MSFNCNITITESSKENTELAQNSNGTQITELTQNSETTEITELTQNSETTQITELTQNSETTQNSNITQNSNTTQNLIRYQNSSRGLYSNINFLLDQWIDNNFPTRSAEVKSGIKCGITFLIFILFLIGLFLFAYGLNCLFKLFL